MTTGSSVMERSTGSMRAAGQAGLRNHLVGNLLMSILVLFRRGQRSGRRMEAKSETVDQSPFRTQAERAVEREQKREAVLRAAVRMFNSQGFHATSLDDVAASLGVSKPTIYHYLGNKDQVLLECVTRGVQQLRAAAEAAHAAPGTGFDRLRDFLTRYAEIIMDDFGRCVIR